MDNSSVTRGFGLLERFLAGKRAEMANKLIPEDSRKGTILDIGCGTIPFFLINSEFNEKYGIDPAIRISTSDDNIFLENFDIEKNDTLPFDNEFFDVVTMLAVFEHIEPDRLVMVLKEIKRVLKKEGKFVLTTPAKWTDRLLRIMAKFKLVSAVEINEHKGAYDHSSIADYLSRAGFSREKMQLGYFEAFLNNWAFAEK